MKRAFIFLISGCLYGSVGDYFHKIRGITVYTEDSVQQFNGTPLWTFFLFGFAGLAIGFVFSWFKGLFKNHSRINFRTQTTPQHGFGGGLFFLALYALSAFIGKWTAPLPDLCLALLALTFWKLFDGTRGTLLFGFVVGLIGMAAEMTLVNLGFFSYGDHLFKLCGVASWVPWLYVTAAVATAHANLLLVKDARHG